MSNLAESVQATMMEPWCLPCDSVSPEGWACVRAWHARPGGGVHVAASARDDGTHVWVDGDTWSPEVIGAPLGAVVDVEWTKWKDAA